MTMNSKVLVITNGPAVGRTTLVNSILRVLQVKGVRVAPAVRSGRAANAWPPAPGSRRHDPPPARGGFGPAGSLKNFAHFGGSSSRASQAASSAARSSACMSR